MREAGTTRKVERSRVVIAYRAKKKRTKEANTDSDSRSWHVAPICQNRKQIPARAPRANCIEIAAQRPGTFLVTGAERQLVWRGTCAVFGVAIASRESDMLLRSHLAALSLPPPTPLRLWT